MRRLSIWQCVGKESGFSTTNTPVKSWKENSKEPWRNSVLTTISDKPPCSRDPASSLDSSFSSISPEERDILHVPFPKLKDIFTKANQILSSAESDIHQFGNDTTYIAREVGGPVGFLMDSIVRK